MSPTAVWWQKCYVTHPKWYHFQIYIEQFQKSIFICITFGLIAATAIILISGSYFCESLLRLILIQVTRYVLYSKISCDSFTSFTGCPMWTVILCMDNFVATDRWVAYPITYAGCRRNRLDDSGYVPVSEINGTADVNAMDYCKMDLLLFEQSLYTHSNEPLHWIIEMHHFHRLHANRMLCGESK